jgi:tetratricopeptide (TPR) repeat protein
MLDGIAIMNGTGTSALNYRIALPTPKSLGSEELRDRAEELRDLGKKERKLGEKMDDLVADRQRAKDAGKNPEKGASSKKMEDAESSLSETRKKRARLEKEIVSRAKSAINGSGSAEDRVLLSVLAKNLGQSDLFSQLIGKISTDNAKDAGYVYYLKAVAKIEKSQIDEAMQLLEKSSIDNLYAIEPPILRVTILGSRGFDTNKGEILNIVSRTEKLFRSNEYATPFSLVSLYYRVATLALHNKDYALAEAQFEKARKNRSLWEKFGPANEFDNMIDIGLANALYGQERKEEAINIVHKVLKGAKDGKSRERVCTQFIGHCV